MAIAHAQFKTGKAGTAGGSHARYISGIDEFSSRSDVRSFVDGNLPNWAKSATEFFDAADRWERANGRAYSEIEFAIPRELKTPEEQNQFAKVFAEKMVGENHPFRLAIHDKKAADGGRNVHAHLMFSERKLDGIERSPEQFFKRAAANYRNRKTGKIVMADPSKGGAGKDRKWNDQGVVEYVRKTYQEQCHEHGIRIDMRSFERRGIDAVPEPKVGRGFFKDEKAAELVAAIRDYKGAMRQVKKIQREISEVETQIKAVKSELETARKIQSDRVWAKFDAAIAKADKADREKASPTPKPAPAPAPKPAPKPEPKPEPKPTPEPTVEDWINKKIAAEPDWKFDAWNHVADEVDGRVLDRFEHDGQVAVAVRRYGNKWTVLQGVDAPVGEMVNMKMRGGKVIDFRIGEIQKQKSRGPRFGG